MVAYSNAGVLEAKARGSVRGDSYLFWVGAQTTNRRASHRIFVGNSSAENGEPVVTQELGLPTAALEDNAATPWYPPAPRRNGPLRIPVASTPRRPLGR